MADIQTKYFTPAEAKKTLPLVKQIVRDILNDASQLNEISQSVGFDFNESRVARQLAANVDKYMRELEEIGCYYKDWDFKTGLVDFPSVIDNEEVLLCWRSDEVDILFYHGVNDGYVGRKPIPEEYFK